MEIYEYRGVEGLVAAEVIKDDADALEFGEVFKIAGVAEIGRTTENSSETHYYDNVPAVVISSTGADTVTCSVSAIPLDVLAKITGQEYDEKLGTLIEGQRASKYFALGYKTKKTNGKEVYVWRFKGQFNIPDQTNSTENDGTDANGQEVVFTGISTTHKFTKTGKPAKAINVDLEKDLADVSTFFDTVTTIDDLKAKGETTVAAPTAVPASGEIASGSTVALSDATAGAEIRYTTDGSNPTATTGTVYADPIEITAETTIKAVAVKDGVASEVATFSYTISA
jgi:phi13 family phage major tail protein